MAMQAVGMSFSKIVLLSGAAYTASIMATNGQLADILGRLQSLVKGLENPNADSEHTDAIESQNVEYSTQVRRLAMEVRQMVGSRQITVLNGGSGQMGSMGSLVMPAATFGALGYVYMWWKGISFSNLMYVTKRNMANAVSSMTKHLEQVSTALAATKKHLTQRLENLDGKLDEQKDISKIIKNEVTDIHSELSQIGHDLESLQKLVSGLDDTACSLEDKLDFPKPSNPRFLGMADTLKEQGLKQIMDGPNDTTGSAVSQGRIISFNSSCAAQNVDMQDCFHKVLNAFALSGDKPAVAVIYGYLFKKSMRTVTKFDDNNEESGICHICSRVVVPRRESQNEPVCHVLAIVRSVGYLGQSVCGESHYLKILVCKV
ncbi:hypothetical protein Scep_017501 [Stephania cephalantha]|uniref:DUF1664 domain-containing protein n=1 Tax=Stephania cephalantha TaxID=152367 RepID=A0AAP0NUA7_9MAGN